MAKKRILLVDDEPDIVSLAQARLEQIGYEVISACDGQEGLDKARAEAPDLIILDLMLPKLDGYKVCQMLKLDEKYKAIPIILFSAKGQESDKKTGEDVGANAYVTKPFEPQIFLGTLDKLLKETGNG